MGNRVNVRNAAYALVTQNDSTGYTIGALKPLPGLMSMDITTQISTGTLYGDGVIKSNKAKLTGATATFAINKIAIEDRAAMSGATINADGIMEVATSDIQPQIAFYAETEADDGTKEQIWLLVGTVQPIGLNGSQAEANINYSTDTMTINFIERDLDHKVFKLADTANATFTKTTEFAANPDA